MTVSCLLEAAAQVLEADGLEGFNTNAVAERAGVSVGSLYQYFPGKDSLTLALMHREDERFHAEASAALAAGDGRQMLRSLIGACVRQQLERPELARLLDIEQARPELRAEASGPAVLLALLRRIVTHLDLPPWHTPALAAADVLAIIRAMTDAAGERREADVACLQRRIAAAAFGYLERLHDADAR